MYRARGSITIMTRRRSRVESRKLICLIPKEWKDLHTFIKEATIDIEDLEGEDD